MKDLCILIFFYMVQALLMLVTGAQFLQLKLTKKQIISTSVAFGCVIWGVRNLYINFKIPFGTHTLVLALLFILIIKILIKTNIGYAIGVSLVSLSLVMLGSGIVGIFLSFIPFTYEQVLNNTFLHILFGHLENSVLIIFLFLSKKYKLSIRMIGDKEGV